MMRTLESALERSAVVKTPGVGEDIQEAECLR